MKSRFRLLPCLALLFTANVLRAEGSTSAEASSSAKASEDKPVDRKAEWLTQYDAAVKASTEGKRRLLVIFTNSKTCAPCKVLKRDVLSRPEFEKYAADNLVLLQVDYAPLFDKENKKTLQEIEQAQGIPKELWMSGRGPWPYLFVISPEQKVLFSGRAYDKERATPETFLAFLEGLK